MFCIWRHVYELLNLKLYMYSTFNSYNLVLLRVQETFYPYRDVGQIKYRRTTPLRPSNTKPRRTERKKMLIEAPSFRRCLLEVHSTAHEVVGKSHSVRRRSSVVKPLTLPFRQTKEEG